jgi:drug/metabolite transporter (DMT)-like permease
MPVALCVITLYTYPLIVAIVGWLSGREPFRLRFALALCCAFAGLVLALDLPGERPSATGIALAASAAIGVALLLVVSERQHAARGSLPFTMYMLGTCMVVALAATVLGGNFSLPHTLPAWIGFVGTPLCYSFSIICMFVAVSMIGSVRTSLFMNLEPVSSVLLGYVLLAQSLNTSQLVGVALVIAAIIGIEGLNAHGRRNRTA